MEQLKQQSSGTDWTVEEECDLCRITYSIYSNFPPMPLARALNAETGEFFPFDKVRKMKSGYAMTEALGYAWACNCRGRKAAPKFEELEQYFELVDAKTNAPVEGMTYRLSSDGQCLVDDATLAGGRTRAFSLKRHPNLTFVAWREGDVR
ncbi:hypothetical protein VSR82_24690 [Burkholderia sp. JPY481]|uniref:hypothetical protein n=1 Tax=Paraburkholderia sp. JPY465 TaxID=3042285 RepID=UPI00316C3DFD